MKLEDDLAIYPRDGHELVNPWVGLGPAKNVVFIHTLLVYLLKYFLTVISNKCNHIHVLTIRPVSYCDWWRQWFMLVLLCSLLTVNCNHINIRPNMYCVSNFGWVDKYGPMSISDLSVHELCSIANLNLLSPGDLVFINLLCASYLRHPLLSFLSRLYC